MAFARINNGFTCVGQVKSERNELERDPVENLIVLRRKLMRSLSKSMCFLFLLSFGVILGTAWAQGPVGTLNGTVQDQTGAVVPGATVTATNIATGVATKTTTTSSGAYTLPYLPYGTYTIAATAPGFQTSSRTNIILRVAQTLTVNMSLDVGQVTQQVTVSSKPELLETGSAEIGRYITAQEYKAWPIMVDDGQRQIQEFIFDSLPGTTGGTFEGSINGGQEYSHEILIEGIPVGRSDLSGGNNNEFSPSAEAIGEFKLQEGAMGAQYNGGQTAVANFTIKSGTNQLHGSAFYYNQNEALAARNLITRSQGGRRSRNRLNNYGWSVGGPVIIPKVYNGHDKTFFFTNFEHDALNNLIDKWFRNTGRQGIQIGRFFRPLGSDWTGNPLSGTQIGTLMLWVTPSSLDRSTIPGAQGWSTASLTAIPSRATSSPLRLGTRRPRTLSTTSASSTRSTIK